ncbi:hypothetical protein F511_19312 [Dorcoceras hygrometricum]|uniref:Uncharacterized protein n=1 Tax=Dorcoceras hygrometricum TaxID=472368 RepID=A0A2Z7AWS6_9LAMI|nr:hypothetical protein F511_19312 [Dorcoceras hygrometricum]
MRSVVSSHGPGSNPRGNAICNAIRSVVASHGPGSNPRGPNKALEEINRHHEFCAAQGHACARDKRGAIAQTAPIHVRNRLRTASKHRRPPLSAAGARLPAIATYRRTNSSAQPRAAADHPRNRCTMARCATCAHVAARACAMGGAPPCAAVPYPRGKTYGITDSACKNQLVVVSVQYGPFNPYIPIRSTTIGKSRVAKDPIAMRTSWRSNSDIASVTSIGYPRMSASDESSTMMHRLLHASGSHPIPPPDDPNVGLRDLVHARELFVKFFVGSRCQRKSTQISLAI